MIQIKTHLQTDKFLLVCFFSKKLWFKKIEFFTSQFRFFSIKEMKH